MSVVGIDFGLDTCYISVARAGGIETVANDYSMRDNPSFVGFGERQRVLAVGAKNQLLTNMKRTFFGFKPLLGRKFSDPIVQREATHLPFPVEKGPADEILIRVDYLSKEQRYTPEQITAMLFTKLRETADAALQTKVKDVVISVPVYYTDRERRALLDAAAIAGFHVLKLMNDTTATALSYGIYKQDLPPLEEKARNVVFVDVGHRGVQVAACSFNKGKLNMQSCAFDTDCGGRSFTGALVDFFANDIRERFRLDPHTNPKALLKLASEAEKIKKQMSANTNKLPLNIECFMEDRDISSAADRKTFEELISPQLERIERVMRDCLAASKWKADDIYAVEIVGGSTRVPAIKAIIERVFGKIPNTTLNADEAVSRGCALQCAILSPTFKVREFSVTDIQPFPIQLRWQSEAEAGEMVVFPQFHAVPFSKMLTFYRRADFSVEGEYDGSAPIQTQHIGKFDIGEVKPTEDGGNQKVKVKVRVNLNGIFTVASASVVEKVEVEEEVPMEVDPPKDEKKEEKKEGETDEKKAETPSDVPMDSQDTTTPAPDSKEAQEESKETPQQQRPPPKTEKRKKVVSKTVDLPVTTIAGSLPRDKLERLKEHEGELSMQDKKEAERLHAKNAVEEYIYDIRSKIYEELANFISEDGRAEFSKVLEAAEDWLYGDGENCDKAAYEAKLKELRQVGEPIKKRREEFDGRMAAMEALGHPLQQASKMVEKFKAGDESYAHLDAAEVEKVVKAIEEKSKWMNESCSQLANIDKTINPPILNQQFYAEVTAFEAIVKPIINKPKPPPPPKEDTESKDKEATAAEDKAASSSGKKNGDTNKEPETTNGTASAEPPQEGQQVINGEQANDMDLD